MKDIIGLILFVIGVIVGAIVINTTLFRTFSVSGPSMQETLHTNDRLVVNRLPHTASFFTRQAYVPERGQVIVFTNPLYGSGQLDEYIVKRVIGLPGERVVVNDGAITVFNDQNPNGFNPDALTKGPKSPTSGQADVIVPDGEIFVAGDNRIDSFSLDSRNGLGTVPLENIQGPVALRIFPLTQLRAF